VIDAASPPVATLRGAPVEADARRVSRFLAVVSLAAMAALVIALFVGGALKNAQISNLLRNGVPVEATVTQCEVEIGGSGSNAAGYSCQGSFVLHGHHFEDTIPGSNHRSIGTSVQLVVVKTDPGLVATKQQLLNERASWRVFTLPTALLVALIALLTLTVIRRRSAGRRHPDEVNAGA
jgi:hypothetical protein